MRYYKILKTIVFNLVLFALLFAGVEIFLRITNPEYQYYYRTHPGQPDLTEVLAKRNSDWLREEKDLGWVCQQKSQLLFPNPPVEGVHYQINEEGYRMPFNLKDTIPRPQKRILLLGDSFLFGIYLEETATITAQLQKQLGPNYRFYPLAIPAWGIDQMYLAYQKYVDLIQPDQVILAFIDDDIMRTQEILFHGCGRKPCLKVEDNQLVDNNDNPAFWEYLCWNNQIGNRLLVGHYQRKAASLCRFLFSEIIQKEKMEGRVPAFIRIPAKADLDRNEPRHVFSMEAFMEKQGIPYTELYSPIIQMEKSSYAQYYIPDDGHFTQEGAEMLARELMKWIK